MPTPLAHSFCGFILFQETQKHLFRNQIYSASFVIFFSTFPDYDYLIGLIKGDLMWGHRMVTHTFYFPLLIGMIVGIGAKCFQKKFLPFFTLTASLIGIHILLDYFCFDSNPENGIGVPLFQPFSLKLYNFPFHPIASRIMGDPPSILSTLINDFYYMVIFAGLMIWRRRQNKTIKKGVTYADRSHKRYPRRA
jgi:membrane-bound metal-dependent hydrolase YbcI (DUF457 family)